MKSMKFSPSTLSCYDPAVHGDNIPSDAVDITEAEYELFKGIRSQGKLVGADADGKPVAVNPPPEQPVVPLVVSMRQARLALLAAGIYQQVNDAVAAMPGAEGDAARVEWEYATEVRRDSHLVQGLSGALSLDAASLDALFTTASKL